MGGSARGYDLVPLSANRAYEENPTISHVPIRGEQLVARLLAPITLEQALLLSRAARPITLRQHSNRSRSPFSLITIADAARCRLSKASAALRRPRRIRRLPRASPSWARSWETLMIQALL